MQRTNINICCLSVDLMLCITWKFSCTIETSIHSARYMHMHIRAHLECSLIRVIHRFICKYLQFRLNQIWFLLEIVQKKTILKFNFIHFPSMMECNGFFFQFWNKALFFVPFDRLLFSYLYSIGVDFFQYSMCSAACICIFHCYMRVVDSCKLKEYSCFLFWFDQIAIWKTRHAIPKEHLFFPDRSWKKNHFRNIICILFFKIRFQLHNSV